jgi:hypothetical protein
MQVILWRYRTPPEVDTACGMRKTVTMKRMLYALVSLWSMCSAIPAARSLETARVPHPQPEGTTFTVMSTETTGRETRLIAAADGARIVEVEIETDCIEICLD